MNWRDYGTPLEWLGDTFCAVMLIVVLPVAGVVLLSVLSAP